jgi:hypothetical protein
MKRLVIDTANLFFRVASAHSKYQSPNSEDKAGLALHSCLVTMNKWFKQVNPDQILVTFEGSKNWRKDFTASSECLSKVGYKANRVRDPSMDHLFQVMSDFEKLAREHTSIVCLSNPRLEGDDLIAGVAQKFSALGDEVVILSGDKDFTQLLRYQGVQLLNPDKGILREHDDPEFFVFEKCIRGDAGDNVRSAYPKVRKTRIEKAFKDEYERTLFMNETWKFVNPESHEEIEYRVGDLFKENQTLMDLEAQPAEIRALIAETIDSALLNHGKFSMFHFSKFLGQHELTKIAENSDRFVRMFNCKPTAEQIKQSGVLQF